MKPRFKAVLSVFLFSFLGIFSVSRVLGQSGGLTTGLVSCWDMNEASGARFDSWGSNDLTDNNTVGQGTGLPDSYSAYFQAGNSEYLSIDWNSSFSITNQFTYYFISKVITDGGTLIVMGQTTNAAGGKGVQLHYEGATPNQQMRFRYTVDGSTNEDVIWNDPGVNTWIPVVITYDGSNVILHHAAGTETRGETGLIFINQSVPFRFGARSGATPSYFDGYIDTVAFWDYSLASSDVSWLLNSGLGRSCGHIQGGLTTYAISLPSGKTGEIDLTMTAGEISIGVGLIFLSLLAVFYILRDTVKAGRAASSK